MSTKKILTKVHILLSLLLICTSTYAHNIHFGIRPGKPFDPESPIQIFMQDGNGSWQSPAFWPHDYIEWRLKDLQKRVEENCEQSVYKKETSLRAELNENAKDLEELKRFKKTIDNQNVVGLENRIDTKVRNLSEHLTKEIKEISNRLIKNYAVKDLLNDYLRGQLEIEVEKIIKENEEKMKITITGIVEEILKKREKGISGEIESNNE